MTKKYQDEDWLREQYTEKGRLYREIAEECGVDQTTINRWLRRFDIPCDRGGGYRTTESMKYRDRDWLHEKYHGEKLSQQEIADECGSRRGTILVWLNRHDIETRDRTDWLYLTPAHFRTGDEGYERWESTLNGEKDHVAVHRLLAVAEYGFEAVQGKVVHHKNGVPWDNRPPNIMLMDRSEHLRRHMDEKYGDKPWRDEETLRDAYSRMSVAEMADEFGCGSTTIRTWMDRYGIERDGRWDARGRTYVFHRCTRCGAEGTRRVDLAEHTCGGE